ncbi:hypothetical protein KAW38_02050 [Candidatus Micrarchaeota archaeon]|nr:hypothetical protein [Candidatus Micrarchaeota archaeon]
MMEPISQAICPSSGISSLFFLPDWQFLSFLAVLISASILFLLYVLNRAFENKEGEAWVKLEIYETFITLGLIVLLALAVDALCSINVGFLFSGYPLSSYTGGTALTLQPFSEIGMDESFFDVGLIYLDEYSDAVVTAQTILFSFYSYLNYITSMTFTHQPIGLGTVTQPTAGFGTMINSVFITALNGMVISYLVNKTQMLVYYFGLYGFVKYFLPLGIVLRSFTPTRKIGGTLIGIAVGFLLIYPILLTVNKITIAKPFNDTIEGVSGSIGKAWDSASYEFFNIWESVDSSAWDMVLHAPVLFSHALGGFVSFGVLMFIFQTANLFSLVAFGGYVFPAFNALVLATGIRYLSRFFGEEIDITNLTRLI